MLTFERTTDYDLVGRILKDSSVYFRMANDGAPARDQFEPGPLEHFEYVIALEDGEPIGLFLLVDQGEKADVHFCFLPAMWGRTEAAGHMFLNWAWKHTEFQALQAAVPGYNALALRLALRCGFIERAIEPHAVRKHRRFYSRILLEIRRPTS